MVTLLKLTTGDTILAEVVTSDDNTIKVKNPMILVPTQQGLLMIPFLPGLKKDCVVSLKSDWVMVSVSYKDLDPALVNDYNQKFGSGVVVTDKMPPSVEDINKFRKGGKVN